MWLNVSITRCIMWALLIGLGLGLLGSLSGCHSSIAGVYVDTVVVKDHWGKHHNCAVNGSSKGGTGIDCDWNHSW